MPRPPARRKQFALAPVRGQPARVTKAHNEKNISDLAQKLKDKPIGRVLDNSDDSDELVTKAPTMQNGRGVARREIFASGGLGRGDEPTSSYNRKRTSDTLQELGKVLNGLGGKRRRVETERTASAGPKLNGRTTRVATVEPVAWEDESRSENPPTVKETLPSNEPPYTDGRLDESPPGAERSILADIKRRPRQASILSNANIPSQDSMDGLGDFDDLDNLEPDDESTPFDSRTRSINGHTSATPSSLPGRRRGSSIPPTPAILPRNQILDVETRDLQHPKSSPRPIQPPFQPPSQTHEDNDTYGPPQSSSPIRMSPPRDSPNVESSVRGDAPQPTRQRRKTTSRSHRSNPPPSEQPKAPSTQSLQNLMPQPRKGRQLRQRKPKDDFDIPSDSSLNSTGNDGPTASPNDSSFLLSSKRATSRKSSAPGRSVKPPPKSRRKTGRVTTSTIVEAKTAKPAARTRKTASQGNRKQSTPPPNSPSSPPASPLLPQSDQDTAAKKSTSTQQPKIPPSARTSAKYTYGQDNARSSRHRRGSDKENQHANSFFVGDGGSASSSSPIPSVLETTPGVAANTQGGRGNREGKEVSEEMRAMRRKFAEVDGFKLDFEEVSLGDATGGSSPRGRWR